MFYKKNVEHLGDAAGSEILVRGFGREAVEHIVADRFDAKAASMSLFQIF